MLTRNRPLTLRAGQKYIKNVHQQEFTLQEEPDLCFRVVNAKVSHDPTVSHDRYNELGHFWYEIWDRDARYRGEYSEGGTGTPKDATEAIHRIRATYRKRLLPVESEMQ